MCALPKEDLGCATCRRCASAPSRTSLLSLSYGGASAAAVPAGSRADAVETAGAGRGAMPVVGRSAGLGVCRRSGFGTVRGEGARAGKLPLPLGVAAGAGRACFFWMDFSSAASLQRTADRQTLRKVARRHARCYHSAAQRLSSDRTPWKLLVNTCASWCPTLALGSPKHGGPSGVQNVPHRLAALSKCRTHKKHTQRHC